MPWLELDKKKTIILADMLELGNHSVEMHKAIVQQIDNLNFNQVFLVGKNFSSITGNKQFKIFQTSSELLEYLQKNPIRDHYILIKGSRGMKLEEVLPAL